MKLTRTSGTGVSCLRVSDAVAAVDYYRDVLGFEQVALLGGTPPTLGLVRKYGVFLLLQQIADDEIVAALRASRRNGPPWDAVLLVDDVAAAHRDLQARGPQRLSDIDAKGVGWDSFEFVDRDSNIVCVGASAAAFLRPYRPSPLAYLARPVAGLMMRRQAARAAREERAHLREFQEFYRRLPDTRDPFYMFFTSGLLHWVVQAESFVPREVNLVLIGSALTDEETRWIADNLDRPFHHVRLPIDDVSAWEYLFATNTTNFGWLDIDCFVLNDQLFKEITALDPGDSMNCAWSWDTGHGFRLANTHFLFVNAAAITAVAARGVAPSPCTYDWEGGPRPFRQRRCFIKVPDRRQVELIGEVLPIGPDGRPPMLFDASYYNTLVVYQLLARASGYPIHQVRDLARRCTMPVDADSDDPEHWPEDTSDELYHLFGISYYQNYDYEPGIRALYLAAEYAMLENSADRLPAPYAGRKSAIAADLTALGIVPQTARERFRQHLVAARRLRPVTAERILAAPR